MWKVLVRLLLLFAAVAKAAGQVSLEDATPFEDGELERLPELTPLDSPVPESAGADMQQIRAQEGGGIYLNATTTPIKMNGEVDAEETGKAPLSFTALVQNAQTSEAMSDSDEGSRRQLKSCTSFENSPRDPGNQVGAVSKPWNESPATCKLFVEYDDIGSYVCSGSHYGPHHLITARHCTYNPCSTDRSPRVRVACGYGKSFR